MGDTEWDDILRKHGIIPEKPPSPTPIIQEAIERARELAHENRLEGKDLDELDELEDDEDDAFLAVYRQKRTAQLASLSTRAVFNQVYSVSKADWSTDVTAASSAAYVVVLLVSSLGLNDESRVAVELWRQLATKFGDVKFCQGRADLCIQNYPDKNTPTILVYHAGDIQRQVVTLAELKGVRTTGQDVESMLIGVGAIEQGDLRLNHEVEEDGAGKRKNLRASVNDDSDSE